MEYVNAVSYVKDECSIRYKDQIDKARYHITKWASEYLDPLPMIVTDDGQLSEGEILLLRLGLGVVQQQNDGALLYLDADIPIQLGQTFEEAVETIAQDGHDGEADKDALLRLMRKQEEICVNSQNLKKAFSDAALNLPIHARSLRDVYQKRYIFQFVITEIISWGISNYRKNLLYLKPNWVIIDLIGGHYENYQH